MHSFGQDLRFVIRALRGRPGFAAAAVLTLALGLASTVTVFSVVRAVLLDPLPFTDPSRLVAIWETRDEGQRRFRVSAGTYHDWREAARSFETLALFGSASAHLVEGGEPEEIRGARVSASYTPSSSRP